MSFKCLLRAHYYGKKKNKEKKMVSGNLQLAFFTDKIRLGIAVYSEMVFFYVKKECFGNYSHICIFNIMEQ